MGNHGSADKRSKLHKEVEKGLGAQIRVPSFLPPKIELLAIGNFDGGEFRQIADLTVKDFTKAEKISIESRDNFSVYNVDRTHNEGMIKKKGKFQKKTYCMLQIELWLNVTSVQLKKRYTR